MNKEEAQHAHFDYSQKLHNLTFVTVDSETRERLTQEYKSKVLEAAKAMEE